MASSCGASPSSASSSPPPPSARTGAAPHVHFRHPAPGRAQRVCATGAYSGWDWSRLGYGVPIAPKVEGRALTCLPPQKTNVSPGLQAAQEPRAEGVAPAMRPSPRGPKPGDGRSAHTAAEAPAVNADAGVGDWTQPSPADELGSALIALPQASTRMQAVADSVRNASERGPSEPEERYERWQDWR